MATAEPDVRAGSAGVHHPTGPAVGSPGSLTVTRLDAITPYLPMWERQRELAAARARGEIDDLLLMLEHEHVYTNGRRGDRAHLLIDQDELDRLGIAYHRIDRGGDITYHGPGQLVGYFIMDIGRAGLSVRSYVGKLEQALARTVAAFGVQGDIVPGYTGVWSGNDKLAAIGVKVSYGVAYHGFALNVAPDLSYFRHITPCGIPDRGVTSLARLTGRNLTVADVVPACAQALATVFGVDLCWVPSGSFLS